MKLHLPSLLIALVSAWSTQADTVLNDCKPTSPYGYPIYTVSDSHLILNGDWSPIPATTGTIDWNCTGDSNFVGTGVFTMNNAESHNYSMSVNGAATVTFDPGITLKNVSIGVGTYNRGALLTCKFENAFSGFSYIALNNENAVADFSKVKSWGSDFEVSMSSGTLRTTNGFTLNSKVSMMCGTSSYSAGRYTSNIEGGLTFATGGTLYCYTLSFAPVNVTGGLKIAGNSKVYFDTAIYSLYAKPDQFEVGDYYYVMPEDGCVIMHADTVSGNLSSLKLVVPRFKVVEKTGTGTGVKKEFANLTMVTLTDMVLVAEPIASGGYDIVMRHKSSGSGSVAEQPFVFPTTITAKQTINIPQTQLPTGTATTILVNSSDSVIFNVASKGMTGIGGTYRVEKRGSGTLSLNSENSYTGGTLLVEGLLRGSGEHSFGTGTLTIQGGTLDLGSKALTNAINITGTALVKGGGKYQGKLTISGELAGKSTLALAQDAVLNGCVVSSSLSGSAGVSVNGNVRMQTKQSFKGLTTVNSGAVLTLADKVSLAGDILIKGGTLNLDGESGLKLGKNQTLTLSSGAVTGAAGLNIGAAATLVWGNGTLSASPVLCGGSLSTSGKGELMLSGTGTLKLGTKAIALKGKGELLTDAAITITDGKVNLTKMNNYAQALQLSGGTLVLGKVNTAAAVNVSGSAALNNGTQHSGNINVSGELIKGTVIKLTKAEQSVNLNHAGVMNGSIGGLGVVNVKANIDASLGKMTNAVVNMNSGTLTNTKGMKLVKGQTLTFGGGNLNLSGKLLTTVVGSTLSVTKSGTLDGNLTMAGGTLVLKNGATLTVNGALTLNKLTELVVNGTTTIKCNQFNGPRKGTLEEFFGVDKGITITQKGNTLTFRGYSVAACAAPETESMSLVAAADVPEEEETEAEPETTVPALVQGPATPSPAMLRPAGDAMVQADWAIAEANRAFVNTLQGRRDSGVLLANGQGMAWASAMGGVSRHGSENGHNGADVNLSGAAVGVEHTAGANSMLGLAVGHTWGRIGATGVQNLRQDTAHVALYGQTKLPHGFTADWSASYGDTGSKGTFYGTRETWSQRSTALSARVSKAQQLNDTTAVRGFAGLNYDATDAGTLESVHTGSVQRLQGEVGAGITHRADKLTTYAEISLTADIDRHTPTVDFGTFRQGGANPGRTGLNLTLGAAYELNDKWSVNAAYHMETAERNTQHSLNVGAGRKF